jgi:hypothetical protein
MRLPLMARVRSFGRRFCDHCSVLWCGVLRDLAVGWDDEEPQVQDSRTINLTKERPRCGVLGGAYLLDVVCANKFISPLGVKEAGRAVNHAAMLLVPVRKTVSFVAFLVVFLCERHQLGQFGRNSTQEIPLTAGDFYRVFTFDE